MSVPIEQTSLDARPLGTGLVGSSYVEYLCARGREAKWRLGRNCPHGRAIAMGSPDTEITNIDGNRWLET